MNKTNFPILAKVMNFSLSKYWLWNMIDSQREWPHLQFENHQFIKAFFIFTLLIGTLYIAKESILTSPY